MSKSKLTLIIDGNWLLMSRMATILGKYHSEKEMMKDLKLLMIKSINIVLRTFPSIDNVIFVADGGSWRNNIEVPLFIKNEGIEYKGNRIKDKSIDWNTIFSGFEDFINKMNTAGIYTCRESEIEGDDWCWYLSRKLNSENTNVIIWSKDRDLLQLVKSDKNGCFTCWWNKENGVFFEEYPDEYTDFLLNPYYIENLTFYKEIQSKSIKFTKIDPNTIIIDKIIRGDQSDNIIPIILRNSKGTSTKKFRVSTKDINYHINIFSDTDINNYISNLISSKNYIGRINKSYENIVEHFKYNRKLVCLNKSNYPDYILKKMQKHNIFTPNKNTYLVEQKIQAEKNDLDTILNSI